MAKVYALVNTDIGSEVDVAKELKKIQGVMVEAVYGVYDMVVTVNAETMGKAKEIINWVRKVDHVRSALVLIVSLSFLGEEE